MSFASDVQGNGMLDGVVVGMSWGDAKNELFELLEIHLSEPREKYEELINDPIYLDKILNEGAKKARDIASINLKEIKDAIGLGSLS